MKIGSWIMGDKNPRWRNGIYVSSQGYVYIKIQYHPHKDKRGYVALHRLLMEYKIHRYLLPSEHVDHIDSNKQNNSLSNLQVVSNSMNKKLDILRHGHPMKGKHHTPDAIEKMRSINIGKKASVVTKLKMSISGKRAWKEGQHGRSIVV